MIISELNEANYLNIDTTWADIHLSNELFAKSIKKGIDGNIDDILNSYIGNNPIINYNSNRIFAN